jgi:hypothetical protein
VIAEVDVTVNTPGAEGKEQASTTVAAAPPDGNGVP